MKIFAVDDDEFILELLPMVSSKAGFPDVVTATSGDAALKILASSALEFDCLILDISMPGMDGIELCTRVRKMPRYRETPILMLTAMTDKDYVDRAFKSGATDYITKPFEISEMGARLRIAEELASTRRIVSRIENPGARDNRADFGDHSVKITDAIQIEGAKNIIDYKALGNYLTQISRIGTLNCQVFAVKIGSIEKVFAQSKPDEFEYALCAVANAIWSAYSAIGYLIGYAGNGVFVIISYDPNLESSLELETEVQFILDDANLEYDDGHQLDIKISIGNPLRPNACKTQGVRKTFERAISRAETRAINKVSDNFVPTVVRRRI